MQLEADIIRFYILIFSKIRLMKWMIIGIPLTIYFVFVSISAAYVADRYVFPIYAVIFALFMCIMNTVWRKLIPVKYEYIVMCLIGTIFIINGFGNAQWDLFKSFEGLLDNAREYSDRNCISVYDVEWREQSTFLKYIIISV